jgi:hypothetical protein
MPLSREIFLRDLREFSCSTAQEQDCTERKGYTCDESNETSKHRFQDLIEGKELHTGGVTGSIPVAPTNDIRHLEDQQGLPLCADEH